MEVGQLKQYNLEILSFSEIGKRKQNDDRIYIEKTGEFSYLFIVADGMGGYEFGKEAAEKAIEIISKKAIESSDFDKKKMLDDAFIEAQSEISNIYSAAGTTICGVLLDKLKAHIFWSGDVKIFLLDERNKFENQEHTLLNLLQETKTIIKSDGILRLKNIVTRSVGGKNNNYLPEHTYLDLTTGFKVLICSDGVHQLFSSEEIFQLLKNKKANIVLEILKNRSIEFSKDNYSAILIYNK